MLPRIGAAAALFVLAAGAGSLPTGQSPDARRPGPPRVRVERSPAPGLGARVERWKLVSRDGETAAGLWRAAPSHAARPWTVVLLGGIGTGDRATLVLPPDAPAHVLAMSWPWRGPLRMSAREFVARAGEIRGAALRSPATLALALEAVARQPEVDPRRVALVGVSLGVPPAVAALKLSRVPKALALIDGGADLGAMIEAGLAREGYTGPPAAGAAALAALLLRPLEPSLNAPAAAGMPVLIINARRDEMLPRRSVLRLHQSFPDAEIHWRPDSHIRPSRREQVAETVREVLAWLHRAPVRSAA